MTHTHTKKKSLNIQIAKYSDESCDHPQGGEHSHRNTAGEVRKFYKMLALNIYIKDG